MAATKVDKAVTQAVDTVVGIAEAVVVATTTMPTAPTTHPNKTHTNPSKKTTSPSNPPAPVAPKVFPCENKNGTVNGNGMKWTKPYTEQREVWDGLEASKNK